MFVLHRRDKGTRQDSENKETNMEKVQREQENE
jgi:hypothetical protein